MPRAQETINDYAYALYAHEGLRRVWRTQVKYWHARNTAYGRESNEVFRDRVELLLAQLDEQGAPRPEEVRYVFW